MFYNIWLMTYMRWSPTSLPRLQCRPSHSAMCCSRNQQQRLRVRVRLLPAEPQLRLLPVQPRQRAAERDLLPSRHDRLRRRLSGHRLVLLAPADVQVRARQEPVLRCVALLVQPSPAITRAALFCAGKAPYTCSVCSRSLGCLSADVLRLTLQ